MNNDERSAVLDEDVTSPQPSPDKPKRPGGWLRKVQKLERAERDYKLDLAYLVEACAALLRGDVSTADVRVIGRELFVIRQKLGRKTQ